MRKDNSEMNREGVGRTLFRSALRVSALLTVLVLVYTVIMGYLAYAP